MRYRKYTSKRRLSRRYKRAFVRRAIRRRRALRR